MEAKIDIGWIFTDGRYVLAECDITTDDNGYTFYCNTHKVKCVFDEGYFCPVILGIYGVNENLDPDNPEKTMPDTKPRQAKAEPILNNLLPCPFCGESVYRTEEEIGDCHLKYYQQIRCDTCGVTMESEDGYRWKENIKIKAIIEELTKRWNTRVAR